MVDVGDKLYCAKFCVDYELDDVKSIHTTREGAESAIREMAEGKEVKEHYDGEDLYLRAQYGYSWYVEVMELES